MTIKIPSKVTVDVLAIGSLAYVTQSVANIFALCYKNKAIERFVHIREVCFKI
jgi:hypothetical protein